MTRDAPIVPLAAPASIPRRPRDQYGRSEEYAADAHGVVLLRRAGYDAVRKLP